METSKSNPNLNNPSRSKYLPFSRVCAADIKSSGEVYLKRGIFLLRGLIMSECALVFSEKTIALLTPGVSI
ncbi:MAG: hypothetical protein RBG13Loki_0332 [Promethearchaeota archaeon CR_4]|nr:MAG: hypothetical protein RBG13Loki_0332 [Candidatus Lokiarchaeota archaeon CR_4]